MPVGVDEISGKHKQFVSLLIVALRILRGWHSHRTAALVTRVLDRDASWVDEISGKHEQFLSLYSSFTHTMGMAQAAELQHW